MMPAVDDGGAIREQMRQVRAHLGAEVRDLVDTAREKTDWRHYVRSYPWIFLGAAAVAGYSLVRARPQMVPLDKADLERIAKSNPTAAGIGVTGAAMGGGLMASLIQGAAKAMLLRGLEAVTRHAAGNRPHGKVEETPPLQIQTDVSEPW